MRSPVRSQGKIIVAAFVRAHPKICWGGSARYPRAALEGQSFTHLREIDCAAFLALMNPGPKVIGPSSPAGNSERRSERVLASTDLPQPRLGRGAPRFGYSVARHCSSASAHWTTIPLSPSFLKKLAQLTCITSKQSQLRPQSSWQQTSSAPRPLHMAARGTRHRTVKTN